MKKIILFFSMVAFIATVGSIAFADSVSESGQAVKEAFEAGSHASKSVAHAIIATGQVTSAVSSVPLAVSGVAGAISTEMANDLVNAAMSRIGEPLEITEETVSVGPAPDTALKVRERQ